MTSAERINLDEQKFGASDEGADYSALFQSSDLLVREFEGDEGEIVAWPVLQKRLSHVADRLELLGYSLNWIERRIEDLISDCYDYPESINDDEIGELDEDMRSYDDVEANARDTAEDVADGLQSDHHIDSINAAAVIHAILQIDLRTVRENDLRRDIWCVLEDCLNERFSLEVGNSFFSPLCSGLGARAMLRILAEHPGNADLIVEWDIGEGVVEEYILPGDLPQDLAVRETFLLVTEGRSDVKVLRKAFDIRRPHISDFFYFVDMNEGYPFGGTGNLHNFCKGLIAIRIQNRSIIIYDNDAVGIDKFQESQRLNLPNNIKVIHLPTIANGQVISAHGPDGVTLADVNKAAASIEYYLDFSTVPRVPQIRWSTFVERVGKYQGALIGKDEYVNAFLDSTPGVGTYDFSKLDSCLDKIVETARDMASELLASDYM